MREIIGLTGPMGAGKSTAAEILKGKGYLSFSFSDEVKKEALVHGLPIDDRSVLQNIGDDLRKKLGVDILAKRTIEAFKNSGAKLGVIEGIRNPGELLFIQSVGGFVIGIDSPFEQRFERVIKRGNPYDPKNLADFELSEQRDRGIGQKVYGQQADECLHLADVVVMNSATPAQFKEKLLAVLNLS